MQFLFPSLTWGFLLVLLPVLIHLINRLRHQRVQWAAMQFLLASYRKHQRWVWLKQLLLLLTRMIILAAVVAMLAHLVTQDQWLSWFGGQTTHHLVLLDDSLSMADRSQGGASAFDRARESLRQLISAAQQSGRPQKLTVLRFSRAARASRLANQMPTSPANEDQRQVTSLADVQAVAVRPGLEQTIFGEGAANDTGDGLEPSELNVGIEPALDLVAQLIGPASKDRCVLHVLSDFRQAEWENSKPLQEALNRLARQRVEINLIRCAVKPDSNLAVVSLQPDMGTQAAGVPLFMKVAVKNFGQTAAERVTLKVRSIFHPTDPSGVESAAQTSELPGLLFDRLEPGETVTRQFQVFFTSPGHQVVEVQLPNDALREDNRRWCVLPLEASESALVIDGDPQTRSSFYLDAIFQPGSRAKTGVTPSVHTPAYLRDVPLDELKRFRAIYLLDVASLDERAETNLLEYLRQGGGVATFLGPQQNSGYYTRAFEAGWFPAPLERALELTSDGNSDTGRLQFGDHPIFRALTGQQNPFAEAIRVQQYVGVQRNWTPASDSGIQVLARLHDGSPIALERSVGAGRSIAFLTSLAPEWNNWAREPSFVVVALQLHAHLTSTQRPTQELLVGNALQWQLDGSEYRPEVTITAAANTEEAREWNKVAIAKSTDNPLALQANLGLEPLFGVQRGETENSGIYDAQLQTLAGLVHHRRWALNVSTQESPLDLIDSPTLRQNLAPVRVDIRDAEQGLNLAGLGQDNPWSQWLLMACVLLLLVEQWLGYRLSYHVSGPSLLGGKTL